jgi:hypothetical protein
MCYWLFPQSGIPLTRTTVQPLSETELQTDDIKKQLKAFEAILGNKIASLVENPNMKMQLYREDEKSQEDEPYENTSDEIEQPMQREEDM